MAASSQPALNGARNRWIGSVCFGLSVGGAVLLHRMWPGIWLVANYVLASAMVLGLLYFIVLEPRHRARRASESRPIDDDDADL
jgi:hypothetical protein